MLLQCLHSREGENSGVLFHLVAILAAIPKPPSHTQSNLPVSTTWILPAEPYTAKRQNKEPACAWYSSNASPIKSPSSIRTFRNKVCTHQDRDDFESNPNTAAMDRTTPCSFSLDKASPFGTGPQSPLETVTQLHENKTVCKGTAQNQHSSLTLSHL